MATKDYGLREDGSPKGSGYLGELINKDGSVMTEYTVGVEIDGKEMDIPTIVPTLTRDEIKTLQNISDSDPIPQAIMDKAIDYARVRLNNGQSVFADQYDDMIKADLRKYYGLPPE